MTEWHELAHTGKQVELGENHVQIINSIVNSPLVGIDPRLALAYTADTIRYELENNRHFISDELREYWLAQTDGDLEQLGYYILDGDEIWKAWIRELRRAMTDLYPKGLDS